jgi:hypothetical protein
MEAQQPLSRQPEAEVSKPKEAVGLTGIMIADDLASVLSFLELSRLTEKPEEQNSYLGAAAQHRFRLVNNLRSIYNLAVGYVLEEDKEDFVKWRTWLQTLHNTANFDELNQVCDYTQKMMKNANLTDLSPISRYNELNTYLNVV